MKKLLKEFKEFAFKGNVIDMAIGVIIGGAFSTIVSSLVEDVLMPLITAIGGGSQDFSALKIALNGDNAVMIGNFINNVINFLLIALCLFFILKGITTASKKFEKEKKEEAPAPAGPTQEELLAEIRDLLKEKK